MLGVNARARPALPVSNGTGRPSFKTEGTSGPDIESEITTPFSDADNQVTPYSLSVHRLTAPVLGSTLYTSARFALCPINSQTVPSGRPRFAKPSSVVDSPGDRL